MRKVGLLKAAIFLTSTCVAHADAEKSIPIPMTLPAMDYTERAIFGPNPPESLESAVDRLLTGPGSPSECWMTDNKSSAQPGYPLKITACLTGKQTEVGDRCIDGGKDCTPADKIVWNAIKPHYLQQQEEMLKTRWRFICSKSVSSADLGGPPATGATYTYTFSNNQLHDPRFSELQFDHNEDDPWNPLAARSIETRKELDWQGLLTLLNTPQEIYDKTVRDPQAKHEMALRRNAGSFLQSFRIIEKNVAPGFNARLQAHGNGHCMHCHGNQNSFQDSALDFQRSLWDSSAGREYFQRYRRTLEKKCKPGPCSKYDQANLKRLSIIGPKTIQPGFDSRAAQATARPMFKKLAFLLSTNESKRSYRFAAAAAMMDCSSMSRMMPESKLSGLKASVDTVIRGMLRVNIKSEAKSALDNAKAQRSDRERDLCFITSDPGPKELRFRAERERYWQEKERTVNAPEIINRVQNLADILTAVRDPKGDQPLHDFKHPADIAKISLAIATPAGLLAAREEILKGAFLSRGADGGYRLDPDEPKILSMARDPARACRALERAASSELDSLSPPRATPHGSSSSEESIKRELHIPGLPDPSQSQRSGFGR